MEWPIEKVTDYLIVVQAVWVIFLSYFLIKTVNHYRNLTKATRSQNLDQILDSLLKKIEKQDEDTKNITSQIEKFHNLQKTNFSKFALIRFNPFEDTGGDQSFVIALLDGVNNGLVITSLHSRGGTRIYAKGVVSAKPTTHPFSKEEKEVVEKACQGGRLTARPVPLGPGPKNLE